MSAGDLHANGAVLRKIELALHGSLLTVLTRHRSSRVSGQTRIRMFHLRLSQNASFGDRRSTSADLTMKIAGEGYNNTA